jgi:signal-transduction protein with cAMP-binding, CBS, and nucleotidyltransferase domain
MVEPLAQPTTELGALNLAQPVHVPKNASIQEAAQVMRAHDISTVLVGDDASALATERDLVQALADGLAPDTPVADVASQDPLWAPEDLHLAQAAAMMLNHGVRHLVVRRADGSTGVLSMRDAFGILLRSLDPVAGWLPSFRRALHLPPE